MGIAARGGDAYLVECSIRSCAICQTSTPTPSWSEMRLCGKQLSKISNRAHSVIDRLDRQPLKRYARRSNDISPEESSFLALRRKRIAECGALKRFLRLEEDVHPDDVPVIALGGSGGGYRACL